MYPWIIFVEEHGDSIIPSVRHDACVTYERFYLRVDCGLLACDTLNVMW